MYRLIINLFLELTCFLCMCVTNTCYVIINNKFKQFYRALILVQ